MEFVYLILMAAAVTAFVGYPFWGKGRVTVAEDPEIAALEAAREAKYREISDAETDLATGKLSQEDYELVNAELRTDAVGLLKDLDEARDRSAASENQTS
ncbi:MAG: hypothetical protein WD181_03515 [Solirubrobacterales bacterium]